MPSSAIPKAKPVSRMAPFTAEATPLLAVSTLFSTAVVIGAKIRLIPAPKTIRAGRMSRYDASTAVRRKSSEPTPPISIPSAISLPAPIRFTSDPEIGAPTIIIPTIGSSVMPFRTGEYPCTFW